MDVLPQNDFGVEINIREISSSWKGRISAKVAIFAIKIIILLIKNKNCWIPRCKSEWFFFFKNI